MLRREGAMLHQSAIASASPRAKRHRGRGRRHDPRLASLGHLWQQDRRHPTAASASTPRARPRRSAECRSAWHGQRISASSDVSPEFDSTNQHIALRHHAKVTMARLGRVDEMRRRARAGKSRRDLAGDMARLSHARDDHPALCRHQQRDRRREAFAQRRASKNLQRPASRRITRWPVVRKSVVEDVIHVFPAQKVQLGPRRQEIKAALAPALAGPSRISRACSSAFKWCR